jgi:hypothetical protein
MLNSVPVIGLKGTDIMFTDTKLGANPGDIVPQWSFFSKLPQDASIDSGKALHFFPFNGNFYVSVGKDVWRKNHRSQNDDLLKQATDNWPMLYESEWSSKIADFLPTDNALDVIPFLEINASRDSVRAHIMTLASDSTVHVWSGDDVNNGGTFATMNYSGSTPANAPTWTQMAYSSGKVCAYDNENNTWELTPNFDASSYTIDNKVPSQSSQRMRPAQLDCKRTAGFTSARCQTLLLLATKATHSLGSATFSKRKSHIWGSRLPVWMLILLYW